MVRLAQVAALGEGWERSSQSSLKLDKLVAELSKCKDKESADAKTIEALNCEIERQAAELEKLQAQLAA